MSLHADASRIDGYLLAVATLKDDGTAFRCEYLGEGEPSGKALDVAERFGFKPGSFELVSAQESLTPENLPKPLEDWLVDRIRPMEDLPVMDRRLVSGLAAELADIFQRAPSWFVLQRTAPDSSAVHQGAFWSIYVFGLTVGSCAIHCSWDD